MVYVTFGSTRSDTTLGLILESYSIGSPEVKTAGVEIPCGDGALDFTEFFGGVKYRNRPLTFNFAAVESNRITQDATVKNALHGKRMNIVLSNDSGHYYKGRVSVGEWVHDCGIGRIAVVCDCEPWRYKTDETTVTQASLTTSYKTLTLANEQRQIVPSITVTAETTLKWGDDTYTIAAGTHLVPQIVLQAGSNTLKAKLTTSGTGSITVTYQEASL